MDGIKGGGSQTQQVKPPAYALPYLRTGLEQAANLYTRPTPADTQTGIDMIRNRATGGDPTINAATDYVRNSLGGGFLNANPHLDATFNRAAQATQGQLASQFAGSGRNVDQSEGLRGQQLNDLASQIYGGAYNNERNLMQGTLGAALPLGNQAYSDAGMLTGIDQQGNALDDYLRRVNQGTYGSTTTSGGGFSGSGAMGGALSGFSMFGPWGALGGGLLGGLF